MPCSHGRVDYWSCMWCDIEKEERKRISDIDAKERSERLEYQKLSELKQIRKLLEIQKNG